MPIIDSVRKEVARSTILMNILQKGRRKEIGRKFGYVITPSMDKDLVRERVVNQVPYSEYFLFNFPVCSAEERKRFVSDIQRMEYINVMNTNKANEQIFCNKFKTYNYFKSFFKREILELNRKTTSVDAVIDFFTRHRTCIFKPINASFGRGIAKVRFSPSASKKEFVSWYEDMMHKYPMGGVLEEYIVQTTDLSDFHPSSLNTLRVSTIRCPNDDVIIFHPFLRLGVGPSIVDNAGSGGLICSVDVSTGEVTACCDECGRRYEYHPDTKRQILGYQIPIWHEIICFVEQLSKSSPKGTNYVGWDIAITDDGCKLVEGNSRGQFIWQYAEQKGCRDELEGIVRLNFDFA